MGTGGGSPWLTGIGFPPGNLRGIYVDAEEFGAERVFVRALKDGNFHCLLELKGISQRCASLRGLWIHYPPTFPPLGVTVELVSSFRGGHVNV